MTASLGQGQWPLFHLKYFLRFLGACPDSNQYNQAVATAAFLCKTAAQYQTEFVHSVLRKSKM